MEFGVYIPQVALGFDQLAERAARCEQLGFASFWLFDHLYAPGLPDQPALEAWTAATALLCRTASIRVGHMVLDNNLRHPALLGRMVTTLHQIIGGRFELGLGSGSYEPEHREGGFPWGSFTERTERLEESLEILTRMFAAPRTTFRGRHYQVDDLPNFATGRPSLHIGGAGTRTLDLVARYADVWNVPTYALDRWAPRMAALDEACARHGRDPATIARSLEAVLVIAEADGVEPARARAERRYAGAGWGLDAGGLVGSAETVVARVAELESQGVSSLVMFPADRGEGDMLELFATHVMPRFTSSASP